MEEKQKRTGKKDYPLTSLKVAEDILRGVKSGGERASPKSMEDIMGVKGGALSRKIASAKRWGLIKGSGMLTITELGKRILHPLSEDELIDARKDAFFGVELFGKIYERFGISIPKDQAFVSILVREYDVKEKDAKTILNIYKEAIKKYLPEQEKNIINSSKGNFTPPKSPDKRDFLSVEIFSPIGKNSFSAETKSELKELKEQLTKFWNLIEDYLPENNNHENQSETIDEG